MTAAVHDFDYDPFAKDVMADPLPFYRMLREKSPVLYLEKYDTFVFSKFQDIADVLALGQNTFVASDTTLPGPAQLLQHNHGKLQQWPLDPLPIGTFLASPHFEVLRHAHIRSLRPSAVQSLATFVRDLANERLDELLPKKRFDLTQDYGGIVAAAAVCRLLGMPIGLAREVLDLVNQCSLTDPEAGGTDIAITIGRCVELMLPFVDARRKAGADGSVAMIDGLITLDHYDRPLTDVEIASQLVCEFIGGTETVPKITAHGLMELGDRPDQLSAVRADLATNVPIVIEEMIRYCAPAQWFVRTAHKDVTVAGQDIRVGQRIMVLYASAARDEDEYDRPDDFIWNRKIRRVISFGLGQHHCTGAHLARLEMKIMVDAFLRRVPAYRFDMEKAVRLPSSFQWGWNQLPVIVGE
ncbi:cytochrome P450 [Nostoc sp. 3335mG]|nr:cytochrome P450 [Nostoc sp. 3335mG]